MPILMLHFSLFPKKSEGVLRNDLQYDREVKLTMQFFAGVGYLFLQCDFSNSTSVVFLDCSLKEAVYFTTMFICQGSILQLPFQRCTNSECVACSASVSVHLCFLKQNLSCHVTVKEIGTEISTIATRSNRPHFSKIFLPFDVSMLFHFINCLLE